MEVSMENLEWSKFEGTIESLRIVTDCINDAVCILDRNCITRYWNKAAEKMYGISRAKIIDRDIRDYFPNSLLPRIIREKKVYENIYNSPRENCYNIISAAPIYIDSELVGGISLDRDVTELVKTYEQLIKSQSNFEMLEAENSAINKNHFALSQIIGNNKKFKAALRLAKDIAKSNINVLITGESGTGKELIAKGIHVENNRRGYFIPINCSAIPGELIESELFGYEGGAFTGALKGGKAGKIELADKGTLFLDEIGDMPLNLQAKILRVLEDGEITRVGGEKPIKVKIRILAATNKDLDKMVEEGTFRKDLYYRLNSVVINLPPLRERIEDIPLLVNRILENFCMEYEVNILGVTEELIDIFSNYKWEGNIRELKNVIQRIVVLAKNNESKVIDLSFLPGNILSGYIPIKENKIINNYDLNDIICNAEREAIIKVMELTNYNKAQAAKLLNIPRSTLYFKLKKYELENKV